MLGYLLCFWHRDTYISVYLQVCIYIYIYLHICHIHYMTCFLRERRPEWVEPSFAHVKHPTSKQGGIRKVLPWKQFSSARSVLWGVHWEHQELHREGGTSGKTSMAEHTWFRASGDEPKLDVEEEKVQNVEPNEPGPTGVKARVHIPHKDTQLGGWCHCEKHTRIFSSRTSKS